MKSFQQKVQQQFDKMCKTGKLFLCKNDRFPSMGCLLTVIWEKIQSSEIPDSSVQL